MKLPLTLLFACFLLLGCKKEEIKKFSIINSIPKKVTVVLYDTRDDYATNNNPVYTGEVAANSTLMIPYSTFKEINKRYYVDWYSDDYTYSNWNTYSLYTNNTSDEFRFNPQDSTSYVIQQTEVGLLRKLLLNCNGTGTKWKTVGACPNSFVPWENLGENDRNYEIEFDKWYNGTVKKNGTTESYSLHVMATGNDYNIRMQNSRNTIVLVDNLAEYQMTANSDTMIFLDVSGPQGLYLVKQH